MLRSTCILASLLPVGILTFPFSLPSLHEKRALSPGPVITSNFPDPSLTWVNGTYYSFSTNSGGKNVPAASSPDFKTWTVLPDDALPTLPTWSSGAVWAPDIVALPTGQFVLYFSAALASQPSKHCIGAATSTTSVLGPYIPLNEPFACPLQQGGAVDASGFQDPVDGRRYVIYKVDGNSLGGGGGCGNGNGQFKTPLLLQEVSGDDGVTKVGEPVEVLDRDAGGGDGALVEAPSLVYSERGGVDGGGVYVLFFSSHCFNGPDYDVKYATASSVTGPYTRGKGGGVLLRSGEYGGTRLNSPGGATVEEGGRRMVFHADERPADAGVRQMWAAEIEVVGAEVRISEEVQEVSVE